MRIEKRNGLAVNLICMLLLCASGVFADYIEGTDTTDVNGYGLDSAFRVVNGSISGQNIVIYHMDYNMNGYFNYSFDDIKIAADSIRYDSLPSLYVYYGFPSKLWAFPRKYSIVNCCFVIKKIKDSTFSKVQILNMLENNQYVFKYGTNTSPNNRLLEKAPYDSSVRYKPNNFNNIFYYNGGYPYSISISSWEPPLPNKNHLLGYIFYRTKLIIDTTAPINLTQWDSSFIITTTNGAFVGEYAGYINLVAVYAEGKSDFLQGWVSRTAFPVDIKSNLTQSEKFQNNLRIKKTSNGFFITLQSFPQTSGSSSLSIYNITGTKVAGFSNIKGNKVFWKTTDRNLAEGQYIVRLEIPDKRVFSGRLVFSRK